MNDGPKLVEGELVDTILVLRIRASRISDPTLSYALRDQVIHLADSAEVVADFVIDFSRVEFMGSVGLVVLLGLRRHATGARIVLVNLSEPIYAVLATSQLVPGYGDMATVFGVAASVAEALNELKK